MCFAAHGARGQETIPVVSLAAGEERGTLVVVVLLLLLRKGGVLPAMLLFLFLLLIAVVGGAERDRLILKKGALERLRLRPRRLVERPA